MRRTGRLVALTFEGILLFALIAGAVFVSVGRILIANIDTFETTIERRLSSALNVPVSFDGIEGSWEYFDPTVSFDGLTIGDDTRPAISMGKVSARINSFASFLEGDGVISELTVESVELDLVQTAEGRWQVVGMPGTGQAIDVSPLFASIEHLDRVDIRGVDIRVEGRRRSYHLTNQPGLPLALVAEGGQKVLSMPLSVQQSGAQFSEFELVGRYRGDPRNVQSFYADLYLQLPVLELSDFLPFGNGDLVVREMATRGEFWLECLAGEWRLQALPVVERLVVANPDGQRQVAEDISATVFADGTPFSEVRVQATDINSRIGGGPVALGDVAVAIRQDADEWKLGARIQSIDVGDVVSRVRGVGERLGFVDVELGAALEAMDPRGQVEDLYLTTVLGREKIEVESAARLASVSLDSHRKSPIVRDIDGVLVIGSGGGYFDLSDEQFGVGFPGAYDSVWTFDSGRGRIAFDLTAGYPDISSELIRVTDGDLTASGRLHVKLPEARVDRTWGLELGVVNADLTASDRYVPNTVDPGVHAWLQRSVRAGRSTRSGMVFHGTLDKVAPRASKTFELFFDVEEATLDYDPAWPPVEAMAANVYVSNRGIFSDGVTGRMLESRITADVDVPMALDNPPDTVGIEGRAEGALGDGLRVLQETPLADATGQLARAWKGTGDYDGTVSLDVPIGPRQGERVGASVVVNLDGNSIEMGALDLVIDDIETTLRFETAAGLSASDFKASLLGYPVAGAIESDATPSGGAVGVSFAGKVDVGRLRQWSGQRLLRAAQGRFDYDAVLHVPFGDRATELVYVEAASDLEGVALDLPPPMGKEKSESRRFRYRQSFVDDGFRIDLNLADTTRASLKSVNEEIVGGRVHFGGSHPGVSTYDDLEVTGALDFVDYARWNEASHYLQSPKEGTLEMAGILDAVEVDIAELHAFGVELEQVRTRITREPGRWHVDLANTMLDGRIAVPDAAAPIDISLEYLRLPADEAGDDGADLLADIAPGEFADIDFRTAELTLGDEDYGHWRFDFRPGDKGASFENLAAEVRGLTLTGGSEVEWDTSGDGHRSRYTGDIIIPDLASAFRQWGFASSVEGRHLKLTASLAWDGSPVMIDLYNLGGPVEILEGSGRFVQAESGAGALRVLGIFDFASLARRFRFDFSDVVSSGFSFSELRGRFRLDDGMLRVVDPIVIVGSGSTFKVGGTLDLKTNALDNDMIVTLPVSRNLPWYAAYSAIATGPLVGAGVWLAQKVFENQIDQMSSAKYKIEGTIDDPEIEFVSIFSDNVRESPNEDAMPADPASDPAGVTLDGDAAGETEP